MFGSTGGGGGVLQLLSDISGISMHAHSVNNNFYLIPSAVDVAIFDLFDLI